MFSQKYAIFEVLWENYINYFLGSLIIEEFERQHKLSKTKSIDSITN